MAFRRHQVWRFLAAFIAVFGALCTGAQDILGPVGGEYRISGNLPGNQNYADLAFNRHGGYVIWQDDAADGDGIGICAQRLNANLSGSLSPIHVNSLVVGHQQKPRIEMLSDGGAVAVWQGGEIGRQNIFARIIAADGTFLGPETRINQYDAQFQVSADVTVLTNDTIVIVWESFEQDGDLRAVVARMLNADGTPQADEFQVNQSVTLNQRAPAVDALPGGGFVVAWISERSLGADINGGTQFTADAMVRKYSAAGAPLGNELKANGSDHLCANPEIIGLTADGFSMAWSQQDVSDPRSGWDIYAAGFSATGIKQAVDSLVNTNRYGDQYAPKLAEKSGTMYCVWTSLGQDGSFDGVVGRVLDTAGRPFNSELIINTSTFNRQVQPAVAADEGGRFLIVWSSYVDGGSFFDLHGQRFAATQPLPVMPAPFASPLSQSSIALSWPELAGFDVQQYEVYMDGGSGPVTTTTNAHAVVNGLVAGNSHGFRLNFLLADGRRGVLSATTTVSTWGADNNFDGLPDDWQRLHFSDSVATWPDRSVDSDDDGASNLAEFLAGTNPMNAQSVLLAGIEKRAGSLWLDWNAVPGLVYQVQKTTNAVQWLNYGNSRFAPDDRDSVTVSGGKSALFRIVRIRQP